MKNIYLSLNNIFGSYVYFLKLQWKLSKLSLLSIIAMNFLNMVNSLVIVIFPGYILNGLAAGSRQQFVSALISFATWEFFVAISRAMIRWTTNVTNEQVKAKLNQMLVEKTTSLRQEQLEHPDVFERFELARKCTNENAILDFLNSIFSLVSLAIEFLGLVYLLNNMPLWGTMLLIGGTVVYALANRIIARKSVEEEEEENPPNRVMRYFSYEVPKPPYAKEIRAFSFQPFISKRHAETLEESIVITKKFLRSISNTKQYTEITDGILSIFFYAYNIFRFAAGKLSVGDFTISMNAIFRFSRVVNSFISQVVSCSTKGVRLSKVKDYLEVSSLYTGQRDVVPLDKNGTFEFVNVSYRYPGAEEYALCDVNICIRFGEKISVVGKNGAGKTTFIALMTGLYKPTKGKILYNGTDIEMLNDTQYKQMFSVLLQDYQIYGFTVLENILFSEMPSKEMITTAQNAIDRIGLRETMEKLPKKEYTYMTQRFDNNGVELSGGEEQKLAIARVFYRDAPICILDEPTASLSPKNEFDIYWRFAELTKDKTVIFISHRLSSCRLCDRIVVFDKGRIVEDGNHDMLMKKNAIYAEMFSKQASLYV